MIISNWNSSRVVISLYFNLPAMTRLENEQNKLLVNAYKINYLMKSVFSSIQWVINVK